MVTAIYGNFPNAIDCNLPYAIHGNRPYAIYGNRPYAIYGSRPYAIYGAIYGNLPSASFPPSQPVHIHVYSSGCGGSRQIPSDPSGSHQIPPDPNSRAPMCAAATLSRRTRFTKTHRVAAAETPKPDTTKWST